MTAVIKQLISPVGIIWLVLILTTIMAWRRRHRRIATTLGLLTLFLTVCGNGLFAGDLMSTLQANTTIYTAESSPRLDAVVVLGGGVTVTPNGERFLNESGDRTRVAVEMYRSGRVPIVVAAGGTEDDPEAPMHIGRKMLITLGIPPERVLAMPGEHTTAELTAFRELAVGKGWDDVGVISDWWHLRRVQEWAERESIDVYLIASGGSSEISSFTWQYHVVPQAGALESSGRAIQEHVAGLITSLGLR